MEFNLRIKSEKRGLLSLAMTRGKGRGAERKIPREKKEKGDKSAFKLHRISKYNTFNMWREEQRDLRDGGEGQTEERIPRRMKI